LISSSIDFKSSSDKKEENHGSLPEAPSTADVVVSAGAEAFGPGGHRDDNNHRSAGAG